MSLPVADIITQGQALLAADQPEAVEALLSPYLAGGVGPIPLWKLLAVALRRQGRFAAVRRIQEMIVNTLPADFTARYDLADTLLTLGDFPLGWREYQHRYRLAHTMSIERKVQRPRWEGEPIPGKTLLIHDEQGFGDTFQFIRLAHKARTTSKARIILEVHREVFSLIRSSLPEFEVTQRGQLPPPFDMHCELMSLPMALDLQLHDLPGAVPYLSPAPDRVAYWRRRLVNLPRPLVALTWAGRPTHPNDANRSIDLKTLAPLSAVPAHFLLIQKGPAETQDAPSGLNLTRLGPEIKDFDDTAAILVVADLLISVDSSPVHLAGALGRPAWVLLPFEPEWRWLTEREDSPWYPQHRLFRQQRRGDWQEVLGRVADAAKNWASRPPNLDTSSVRQ